MTTKTAWQCLSVDEFVSKCNWENILQQTAVNSLTQQGKSLTAWQCLTAQDFFCFNNWSGEANHIDLFDLQDISKTSSVFDITSTPKQFWQCFNWSGQHNLSSIERSEAALTGAEELVDAVEEFTFNNLSQLF